MFLDVAPPSFTDNISVDGKWIILIILFTIAIIFFIILFRRKAKEVKK